MDQSLLPFMIELLPGVYTDMDKFKILKIQNITFTGSSLLFKMELSLPEIVSMGSDLDSLRLTITNSTYFKSNDGNYVPVGSAIKKDFIT